MGVEYGENPPQTERQKASICLEFLPNGGLARFFSALLGGIPRKKWAKQEVTLGWNAEKHLFFNGWNVEKGFACKDVAYVHFLGIPSLF
jgi:hypothetical protein